MTEQPPLSGGSTGPQGSSDEPVAHDASAVDPANPHETPAGAGVPPAGLPATAASASEVFGEALAQAARRAGIDPKGEQDAGRMVWASIGGVRGILEAVVPSLVFVVAYTLSYSPSTGEANLPLSLALSVGLAAIFTLARLIARSAPSSAIAGLVGTLVAAALALFTGRGEDNFVLGFFTNGAYGSAFLISVMVGWPLIGLIAGFLTNVGTTWRQDRRQRRISAWLSLMWAGLFFLRLAVQLPLYFASNADASNVIALGYAKLAMGIPLFAPALVVTYLVARSVFRVGERGASA